MRTVKPVFTVPENERREEMSRLISEVRSALRGSLESSGPRFRLELTGGLIGSCASVVDGWSGEPVAVFSTRNWGGAFRRLAEDELKRRNASTEEVK